MHLLISGFLRKFALELFSHAKFFLAHYLYAKQADKAAKRNLKNTVSVKDS